MRALLLFTLGVTALGCRPDLGDPESLVTSTRILAVQGEPPEAKQGDVVSYRALVATPADAGGDPALEWAFCAAPRPLTEDNAVSAACLGDGARPIGSAASIDAPTPLDACQLFGPDPPPGGLRPRDPDATGGFYQPVRVRLGSLTAFALERVTCDLPNAPIDVAIELSKRYRANQNPKLTPLVASVGGAAVALDHVPAGARVELTTGWGAGDAETYVMFDPETSSLVERREALRVSWFVTAGELADEATGRDEADLATTTTTTWTAPPRAARARLWLVLRDSRGGVDFAAHDLRVIP